MLLMLNDLNFYWWSTSATLCGYSQGDKQQSTQNVLQDNIYQYSKEQ